MNKVALYARVSTDQQTTGLESQVRILKDYCFKNDILRYEIFIDEGISGTKSSRPALDRMMAAVTSKEVGYRAIIIAARCSGAHCDRIGYCDQCCFNLPAREVYPE